MTIFETLELCVTAAAVPLLIAVYRKVNPMSDALARLTASVEAEKTVDASILALVTSMAQQIRDNANDPDALNKLADDIDAQNAQLQAAVTANTPAATSTGEAPTDGSTTTGDQTTQTNDNGAQ